MSNQNTENPPSRPYTNDLQQWVAESDTALRGIYGVYVLCVVGIVIDVVRGGPSFVLLGAVAIAFINSAIQFWREEVAPELRHDPDRVQESR